MNAKQENFKRIAENIGALDINLTEKEAMWLNLEEQKRMFCWNNLPVNYCPFAPYYSEKCHAKLSLRTKKAHLLGGMIMGQFTEIMACISIMITAVLLLVQNIIEDRQEKREAKLQEAKSMHEEIRKRWAEAEKDHQKIDTKEKAWINYLKHGVLSEELKLHEKIEKLEQKKSEFLLQFKEMTESVASALNVGYSAENAFKEAGKEMKILYPDHTLINRELEYMVRKIRLQIPLEQILNEFAERVELEDVKSFSTVFAAAKRSGGDMMAIIHNTATQIGEKIDVKREIDIILAANAKDLARMSPDNPKYDRLKLTPERVGGIASDMENVAGLPSPLGKVLSEVERPNGMVIEKVSVPFGVIGVIYEARPNVTADVFSLCFRSGNVCVLKGGSDADDSSRAIVGIIHQVLAGRGGFWR